MSFSLIPVSSKNYIVTGVNSVGVVINDNNEAVLIDSGLNSAKGINKLLRDSGYTIVAIINTHHHSDHCGGNSYFSRKYPELKIYATDIEKPLIEYTALEPNYLCSGASPFVSMTKNAFLEAQPSIVTHIIQNEEGYQIDICGMTFTIHPLPGHTKGMVGVSTEEGVLYCADAIFGQDTLNKYGIMVYTDISASKRSFEKLLTLSDQYQHVVAYHGGQIEDPKTLVNINKDRMEQLSECLLKVLEEGKPLSIDDLTAQAIKRIEPIGNINIPPQYLLCRMTVQAHVAYLEHSGKVVLKIKDNNLVVVVENSIQDS